MLLEWIHCAREIYFRVLSSEELLRHPMTRKQRRQSHSYSSHDGYVAHDSICDTSLPCTLPFPSPATAVLRRPNPCN